VRIGSLCSGYGGLEMGVVDAIGGTVAWHAENDRNASRVLAHHYPDIPNHGDITAIDWTTVEPVDVMCAGFPCQPLSKAGKRKGADDERWIWPHITHAVRVVRPRLVVLENVGGLLVSWRDGHGWRPAPIERVVGDLADLRYDATWRCVRASGVGAPHQRERVFIVAADTDRPGLARRRGFQGATGVGETAAHHPAPVSPWGAYAPAVARWEHLTRPAPCPVDERGELNPRFSEWMMGLPDGWVTAPGISHTAQLKILGNGVVPQQAAYAVASLMERTSGDLHAGRKGCTP
jgi:DNA (cytosine-5)-methyltransferase 1